MPTFVWMLGRNGYAFVCLRHPEVRGRPLRDNKCPWCAEDRAQGRAHFGILAEQAEGGVL